MHVGTCGHQLYGYHGDTFTQDVLTDNESGKRNWACVSLKSYTPELTRCVAYATLCAPCAAALSTNTLTTDEDERKWLEGETDYYESTLPP